jgi:hypothetical protein
VRKAITDFVVGCKADGIWSAIKASCILMGARTLSGALTPLVGPEPTNNGPFVGGDYNRKTGLVGNASSKYLDSNRNNDADPQNSNHNAVYVTDLAETGGGIQALIGSGSNVGVPNHLLYVLDSHENLTGTRNRSSSVTTTAGITSGLIGVSRSGPSSYTLRQNKTDNSLVTSSSAPSVSSLNIFRMNEQFSPSYTASRIAFYSIGESVDLALLDSRATTLYTAIGNAIP